jgi:hypothetical protein
MRVEKGYNFIGAASQFWLSLSSRCIGPRLDAQGPGIYRCPRGLFLATFHLTFHSQPHGVVWGKCTPLASTHTEMLLYDAQLHTVLVGVQEAEGSEEGLENGSEHGSMDGSAEGFEGGAEAADNAHAAMVSNTSCMLTRCPCCLQ